MEVARLADHQGLQGGGVVVAGMRIFDHNDARPSIVAARKILVWRLELIVHVAGGNLLLPLTFGAVPCT